MVVYGYGRDAVEGNLTFKSFSEHGLLEDMAQSAYVICGGGHTLMSEALYYGKPIISLPVKGAFEQWLNAHYLEKLGYGRHLDMLSLTAGAIADFEQDLEGRRRRVAAVNFRGNEQAFALVQALRGARQACRLGGLPGPACFQ